MSSVRRFQRDASVMLCLALLCCPVLAKAAGSSDSNPPAGSPPDVGTTQPAAASWVAKPPDHWPQMLLKNQITIVNYRPWQGVTGFLMQLPTGQTVAVTTFNTLVQGINLEDLKGSVASWAMIQPTRPMQRLILHQLAVPPNDCKSMNCVVRSAGPASTWPSEVLIPSPQPARVGQKVFLVGTLSGDDNNTQTIYSATILALDHPTPGLIAYQYQAHVPPGSFSGAPILDEEGHVVGIQQSYYPEGTSGDTILGQAFQISTILAAVNLPPEPKVVAPKPAVVQTINSPATLPTDPNQAANAALRAAKLYISAQRYDIASTKLRAIIQTYPNTSAAKEAQTELDSIQDKASNPPG